MSLRTKFSIIDISLDAWLAVACKWEPLFSVMWPLSRVLISLSYMTLTWPHLYLFHSAVPHHWTLQSRFSSFVFFCSMCYSTFSITPLHDSDSVYPLHHPLISVSTASRTTARRIVSFFLAFFSCSINANTGHNGRFCIVCMITKKDLASFQTSGSIFTSLAA